MRWTIAVMSLVFAAVPAFGDKPIAQSELRSAVHRALQRIDAGAGRYPYHRTCFSCHHQSAIPALAAARDRGFEIDAGTLFLQMEFTRETFRPKIEQVAKGQSVGGANTTVAYALMVLEAGGHEPDETTAALVRFLVARQANDGSWPAVTQRPPSEGSSFTNAALALRALRTYGTNDEALDPDERAKIETAWKRGRDWLLAHEPKSMEDRVFHLMALVAAEAGPRRIKTYSQALRDLQRDDGSWSQLPDRPGDAYATGLALLALHRAGDGMESRVWQRGAAYLLRTQRADGSWIVETRSKPIQVFFDNGDPGGKSQFISMLATNWSVLALLQALPAEKPR